jgi:hypothetical protein
MLLRTTGWLVLVVFLFTLTTGGTMVEAKTTKKDSLKQTKKWVKLDGFRSAKFGMDEKKVMRAIAKDFKVSKNNVEKTIHPSEKTKSLMVIIPNLWASGGTAKVVYILGQKTKRLIQVNVFWGKGVAKKVDGEDVVAAAIALRTHFLKKQFQEGTLTTNAKLNDANTLLLRGKDRKNRMVLLLLTTPPSKNDVEKKEALKNVSLKLSYILDADKPDVLSIKEGEF